MVRRFLRQFRMGEKAKNTKPVTYGYGYNPFPRHALAIITRLGTIACTKAAAVKIYQHG